MNKCDNCLNARVIISENGRHASCCLTEKSAVKCLIGMGKDFYEPIPTPQKSGSSE